MIIQASSRATVPNKLNLETLREAKSADSTGAPAILTGTGNTKRNTEVADISQMRSWVESRRTVAKNSPLLHEIFFGRAAALY